MMSFNGPAPRIPAYPYCRVCGDEIDGLGLEIGKTLCFQCESPASAGGSRQGEDSRSEAEGEASQSGPKGDAQPSSETPS